MPPLPVVGPKAAADHHRGEQRAVAQFVRWAQRIDDVKRKREFYPDVDKRDLFKEGYISDRSGHSRGSTLDLTLVRRADARELDMGSPFDFFSPKSWPSDRSVSDEGQKNRALRPVAIEHFEAESARRQIALDRRQRVGRRRRQ